ncbi:hypothetical protein D1BOALGB6SA_9152 [Olavius sp. associated proteobacterium Delta 1]|nr:hypothetical protein D1BOALGB6SA_9152 [Olavius sp. associated proteobacterium Delta 1]
MCQVNYQYVSAIEFPAGHKRQAELTLREIDGELRQIRNLNI